MECKYKCKHCGGDIRIRNPKGYCDHLYYPDYCEVCKKAQFHIEQKPRLSREEIVKKLAFNMRDTYNTDDLFDHAEELADLLLSAGSVEKNDHINGGE